MFDYRKSESGSAGLTGTPAIETVKPFENSIQMFREDSVARIGNGNYPASVIRSVADFNEAARIIEFYGVVDKVGKHLFQTPR
ncbi:hypothetical protein OFM36_30790, partial [Escherichia coli]|nr:hypothetical protein [Escherichia coli]